VGLVNRMRTENAERITVIAAYDCFYFLMSHVSYYGKECV